MASDPKPAAAVGRTDKVAWHPRTISNTHRVIRARGGGGVNSPEP